MIAYETLKPYLFKLQPENAHHLIETILRFSNICPSAFNPWTRKNFVSSPLLEQELFGCTFLNPVGLAAGFDKNATMIRAMQALGFGFTEIGTLTPKPQEGNPKPRMWRHIEEESIQNAMGFNNDGLFKIQKRLQERFPFTTPIGVNVGKNKLTSERDAISDYTTLIKALHKLGDYIVINISSPNTPGLRDLQNEEFITRLFEESKAITDKPILLKIAPDMEAQQAIDLTSLAVSKGANGIIATNTTIDYSLVKEPQTIGGLSGAILKEKSFDLFEAIAKELYGKTTLVSVGGISDANDVYRRLKAGANLVQILSGMVYKGPEMVGNINRELIELIQKDGYTSLNDVIGADRK